MRVRENENFHDENESFHDENESFHDENESVRHKNESFQNECVEMKTLENEWQFASLSNERE